MSFKEFTDKGYPWALLRVFVGSWMLYSGLEKITAGNWSAVGYLQNATGGSPLHGWFVSIATAYPTGISSLVMYGETLIGLGLLVGVLVRAASFFGIIMNGFFWVSQYPWDHGPFSDNSILVLLYVCFILVNAGRYLGGDAYLKEQSFVKNNSWLTRLIG